MVFLTVPSNFQYQMKTMGSQSEALFHEILDVQKILVGWTTCFTFSTEIWAEQLKNHPVYSFIIMVHLICV